MRPSEIPNAKSLKVAISPDGKWLLFDFDIGAEHEIITMPTCAFGAAVESVFASLSRISMNAVPPKGLQAAPIYKAEAVAPIEFGVSNATLDGYVVAEFEFSAQAQLRIALTPTDSERLAGALQAGAAKAKAAKNLTRQ
jgi:hypothetical protein